METPSSVLIDALGGISAVSRMMEAPTSTVHSWRRNGIPRSRLAHLRLIAQGEKPDVPFDTLAARINGTPAPLGRCQRCDEVVTPGDVATCGSNCPMRAQAAA